MILVFLSSFAAALVRAAASIRRYALANYDSFK